VGPKSASGVRTVQVLALLAGKRPVAALMAGTDRDRLTT